MHDRLQMRAALIAEARGAAIRLPSTRLTEWSINENAGTVIDVSSGELIVYLDPIATTPEWEQFAARAW